VFISSAPLRISFLGGGTDYPEFFREHEGAVFGAGINLRVFVNGLSLPPFANEKIRFTYRHVESVSSVGEIKHPVLKAVLMERQWKESLNIGTMADVAGNSGLGSSSAFTVALIALLDAMSEQPQKSPLDLACEAIRVERDILKESGGWQDQLFTSFGGLSEFKFYDGVITAANTLNNKDNIYERLSDFLMLLPIGGSRQSAKFAAKVSQSLNQGKILTELMELRNLTYEVSAKFQSESSGDVETLIEFLAKAMVEAWKIKKVTHGDFSMSEVDEIISRGIKSGALAGKLCGSGGGGFILFLCPPELKGQVASSTGLNFYKEIRIDPFGVQVDEVKPKNDRWELIVGDEEAK